MIVEDSQNWLPEGAEVVTEAEEITTDTWLPEGAILESTEDEEDIVEEDIVEEEPLEEKKKKNKDKLKEIDTIPLEVSTTETDIDETDIDETDIDEVVTEETDPPRYSYKGKEYDEEGLKKLAEDSNITVDELLKKRDDDNNLLVTEIQEGYTSAESASLIIKESKIKEGQDEYYSKVENTLNDLEEEKKYKTKEWYDILNNVKENNPESYNELKTIIDKKFEHGEGKASKNDILDLTKLLLANNQLSISPHIKYEDASKDLQGDINTMIRNRIDASSENQSWIANSPKAAELMMGELVDGKYENVVGYNIGETIENVGFNKGYESGYTTNPVTGLPFKTGEREYKQQRSAQSLDIYIKDGEFVKDDNGNNVYELNGKIRKVNLGSASMGNLGDKLKQITTRSTLVEGESPKVAGEGLFDLEIKQLQKQIEGFNASNNLTLDQEEAKALAISKLEVLQNSSRKASLANSNITVIASTAQFVDDEGYYDAKPTDFVDKKDDGSFIYNSFDVAKSVNAALDNLEKNSEKIFNPEKVGIGVTSAQQFERNFNNSTWIGFGFRVNGNRVYSDVATTDKGVVDGQDQFEYLDTYHLDLENIGFHKGVPRYVELDFGPDVDHAKEAKKLQKFLKNNIPVEDEEATNKEYIWNAESDQKLVNNLIDNIKDQQRAMGVIDATLTQYVSDYEKHGLPSLELLKTKHDRINIFTPRFEKELLKIQDLKNKLGITSEDAKRINAMPEGPERNRAIARYNKNTEKLNNKKDKLNSKTQEILKDSTTPLGLLGEWTTTNAPKGEESRLAVFTLPSGEKLKISLDDLKGYGIGESNFSDENKFQNNIKILGLEKGTIDYTEDLSAEEEWALLQKNGFNAEQILELQGKLIESQGERLLIESDKLEFINKLQVDKNISLNSKIAMLAKKEEYQANIKKRATGIVSGTLEPLTKQELIDYKATELRAMTWGELGSWTAAQFGENATGMFGGALKVYLRGMQLIGMAGGLSDEDLRRYDTSINQLSNEQDQVNSFLKSDIHTDVDEQWSNSIAGQISRAVIDMVFDIAIGGGASRFKVLTKSGKLVNKRKAAKMLAAGTKGKKGMLQKVFNINGPIFFKGFNNTDRMFSEIPSFNQTIYAKDENGEFELDANGEKIVISEPPSAAQKFGYSVLLNATIGYLDKMGIESQFIKADGKFVNSIITRVINKSKNSTDDIATILRKDIQEIIGRRAITVGGGMAGEVATELLQTWTETGAQDLLNAMNGFDGDLTGFINPDWGSPEFWDQAWDVVKVSAGASGVISGFNATVQTVTDINQAVDIHKLRKLSNRNFEYTYSLYSSEDMMNAIAEELDKKAKDIDNDFTSDDANRELKTHRKIADIMSKIDPDLKPGLKRKAFEKMSDIQNIKEEIYKKDDQGNLTSTLKIDKSLAKNKLDKITKLEEELENLHKEVETEEGVIKDKYKKKETNLKYIDNVVKIAKKEGVEVIVVKSKEEAIKEGDKHNIDMVDGDGNLVNAGFDGENTIIINESISSLTEEGKVADTHELLHKFLATTLNKKGNENLVIGLSDAIDTELSKLDPKTIEDSEFKKRLELYKNDPLATTAEEKLTLLSDALLTGDIKLEENVVTKFKNTTRRLLQSIGLKDIKLDNSKDVINLIKDFHKSVKKSKLTKAQRAVMQKGVEGGVELVSTGESIAEAEAEADTKIKKDEDTKKEKKSKTKIFDKKKLKELDTQVEKAINRKKEQINKQKDLVSTGSNKPTFKQKQRENVDKIKQTNKEIQNLEDIKVIREGKKNTQRAENRLTENTKDIRAKIAKSITNNPSYFAGIAPEAVTQGMGISKYADAKKTYQESLENNLAVMIKNEWDPTIEPDLEKFVRNRGFVRAKSLATELGVVDTRKVKGGVGITKDISTAIGLSTDEDIEADIDKVEKEKAYLVKDKLPGAKAVYDKMKGLTKDVDVDSKTYKQTPKVALDATVGMFMTDPDAVYQGGKVKGQNIKESIVNKIKNNANLNKQDIAALKPYLEEEITVDGETSLVADILQESLPDGTTPSGTATGVQNVLLKSPLYKKGERVKTKKTGSKAGLPVQVKQKMPTEKFIELFNNGELMKALIVQTDRILTNQAARETKKKPAAKIGEGRSETMYSKSDILTTFDKKILNVLAQQRDINAAIKKIGIDGKVTINKSNRKAKQAEVLKAIKDYGLTPNVLTTAMMASGGAVRVGRMEVDPKTKEAVKVYYYKLTNGDWIKARKSEKSGLFNLQPETPKGLALETNGSKLYFGKSDPAYVEALKAAEKNLKDGKKENEFKRIHVPKDNAPIDEEFIIKNKPQSDINMGILEDVVSQLADAVNPKSGKGMPIETAALFILQGYQASSGLIKAAAPFKYVSRNFEWSTDPRAKKDDTEESNSKNKYREEHNPPASVIGASLIWAIANNKVGAIMPDIKKNFTQTQLSKSDDTKIDIAGLASTLPEGASIINNPVLRDIEAGLNLNNIINPLTGKTKAEENGVGVDPKYYNDPDVVALQNEILKQKLNGEPVNVQKKLKAYLPLAPKKNKARVKMTNEISGSKVKNGSKYSKNNSNEVIRELGILDKALKIARDPNAPVKKIRVFDFDDTVAETKSKVIYSKPNKTGKPSSNLKAVVMAGGPGSGKSSVIKKLGLQNQGYKVVNQDISLEWAKELVGLDPKEAGYDAVQRSVRGELGALAIKIADKKLNQYTSKGKGVILDGTGASIKATEAKVKALKDKGYEVSMIYVETSKETALERNRNRKERSLKDKIVETTWNSVNANKQDYKNKFGESFFEVNANESVKKLPIDVINNIDLKLNETIRGKISPAEFAKKGTEMEAEGVKWDFSEFNKVVDGKKGPLLEVAKKIQAARGTEDVFILTARAQEAAGPIKQFLESVGLNIPINNVTGLGDSSPLAKSGWIVDKAAEGYNDFYFADDHTANVNAVKKVLDVIDVKSKVQQAKAKFSKTASNIFNDIIENKTGIESQKVFSDAKAKVRGKGKGKFRFFIPPSAEDFEGLLYKTLSKGKLGNDQKAWYKEVLFDPFARGMNDMATDEKNLISDFKALKKALKKSGIPKNLNKKAVDKFTYSDVARILAWDKQGVEIDGLSKTDLAKIKKFAEKNPGIDVFAQQLIDINKGSGYKYPGADWLVGTVATDLRDGLNTTKREDYLQEWQANVDLIFTNENLNKLEAAYGSKYREAIENSLFRMKTGRNRTGKGNRIENQLMDYLNNSVGAVMFLNMRSAALQTLSAVNFANWSFNNPMKMAKAFANQPQYWKDFMKLMNSDFLVTRRSGLKINVSESEIANAAATGSNKVKGVLNSLLKKGFLPTQIADSFAIATGGATFYRNRINDLMKNEGMSEVDAEAQAYQEFREISETSQQSSRPDKISQQQSSGIGRVILAFANTPSQYARIIKKSTLDLVNGRGDWRHNMSKILYYGFAQNLIFNALQQAIFAWGWDDEEEEEEKNYDKEFRVANGMMDSILRGLGWGGALVSALKNVGIDAYDKLTEEDPSFKGMELDESGLPILDFSPPVDVKVSKLMRGGSNWEYNSWKPEAKNPFDINNPAYKSIALVVAATTNVPLDRLYQKYENLKAAFAQDQENWKRVALLFGYPEWQLESSKQRAKRKEEEKERKRNLKAEDKVSIYNKEEQVDILKQYGLSQEEIDALKNEPQRVEAIERLRKKKKVKHVPSEEVKKVIKKKKEEVEEKKEETKSPNFKTTTSFNKSKNKEQDVKVRIVAEDRSTQQTRLYKLKKQSQIDTLISLGVPKTEIPNYEGGRVALIERLYKEKKEKETVSN